MADGRSRVIGPRRGRRRVPHAAGADPARGRQHDRGLGDHRRRPRRRRVRRAGRRRRLRQLGHDDPSARGAPRRAPVPQRAHRRRVAGAAADAPGRRSAARDGCARRRPGRRHAPAARRPRRVARRHDPVPRGGQRAGEDRAGPRRAPGRGDDRDHRTRAQPRPHRAHARRARRARDPRSTSAPVRVTAGAPDAFEFDVPGDPSSAAFWAVAATITPGSELVVEDVALNPTRIAFVDVLARMGAAIELVDDRRAARRTGRGAAGRPRRRCTARRSRAARSRG